MSAEAVFALYRGDKFVDMGTKKELAERHNVKPTTIGFYATPAYKKRIIGKQNVFVAIRIDDDEVDDG